MFVSSETPSCVPSKQKRAPLNRITRWTRRFMTTKQHVTWQCAFISCKIPLSCSFLIARNTIWSYCLLVVETSNRWSLLCKTSFKLQYPCHAPSICHLCPVWCLNIPYLPWKSPQFTIRSSLQNAARICCFLSAKRFKTWNSSSNNTRNMLFLSRKMPVTCSFYPAKYLQHASS